MVWVFALVPLAFLLVLLGLYVYAFKRARRGAFRASLSVFALGFLLAELYCLYTIVALTLDFNNFIMALPAIGLFTRGGPTDYYDWIVLPFEYFATCGLLTYASSLLIQRVANKKG